VSRRVREELDMRVCEVVLRRGKEPDRPAVPTLTEGLVPSTISVGELRDALDSAGGETGLAERLGSAVEAEDAGRPVLVAPLVDSAGVRGGCLLMVKQGDGGFGDGEISMVQNLTNTISLEMERQGYVEELRTRSATDQARAELSDKLLTCRTEDQVYDLTLDFFSRSYGLARCMFLIDRNSRFVFIRPRHLAPAGEASGSTPAGAAVSKTGSGRRKRGRKLESLGYIPADADNPAVRAYRKTSVKMEFFECLDEVFRNFRPAGSGRRTESLIHGSELLSGQAEDERAVAVKIPDVGVVCGVIRGDALSTGRRPRETVVNTVSTTIKELRLERARELTRERTAVLHGLDLELYKIPMGNMAKKLQRIIFQIGRFLGAERALIFLPDSDHRSGVQLASSYGRTGRAQTQVMNHVARHVLESGDEIVIPQSEGDTAGLISYPGVLFGDDVYKQIEAHYPAFFAAPIRGDFRRKREILAVIAVGRKEPFSPEDRHSLYDFTHLLSGQINDELLYERERELATKDELTGLNNRRYFLGRAEELFKISKRYGKKFSMIMMDIDFFKDINDTYGHEAGDRVLVGLADSFRRLIREVDVLGRYGGEEFILLLPETDMRGAANIAERIRRTTEKLEIPYEGQKIRFTISAGVVTFGENSRYFQGVPYQVRIEEETIRISVDEEEIGSFEMSLSQLETREGVDTLLDTLFRGTREKEEKKGIVRDLIRKITSLDGLISVADGRLYKSKVMGRNRVTTGAW